MSQKRYNSEFKQTVVELYRSGTLVSQLSSEYGISEVTIYKWIKQHSKKKKSIKHITKALRVREWPCLNTSKAGIIANESMAALDI